VRLCKKWVHRDLANDTIEISSVLRTWAHSVANHGVLFEGVRTMSTDWNRVQEKLLGSRQEQFEDCDPKANAEEEVRAEQRAADASEAQQAPCEECEEFDYDVDSFDGDCGPDA